MKARTKSTKEVLAREMDVFLLDGFHFNGPDSELLQFSNTQDVLAEIVSPTSGQAKVLLWCWKPCYGF